MFRSGQQRAGPTSSFPRVRGDVPRCVVGFRTVLWFSPRARGCSEPLHNHTGRKISFPRVRGDVPKAKAFRAWKSAFSPRARGCSSSRSHRFVSGGVFPAYAGMFRFAARACYALPSFPRVRGDVPAHKTDTLFVGEFSPQARRSSATKNRGILPAQTGTFR